MCYHVAMNMSRHPLLFSLIPPLLLVAGGLLFFGSAGLDDNYITYGAAHMLAHHGDILNYNGERIEQSSSLLHVLVLALLAFLSGGHVSLPGYLLVIFCGMACVFLAQRLAALLAPVLAFPSALLTSVSSCIVYWSFGGLETTLTACCLVWVVLELLHLFGRGYSLQQFFWLVFALFSFLLVRPEHVFVLLLTLALLSGYSLLEYRTSGFHACRSLWKDILVLSGITGGLTLLLLLFRAGYFGSLFPQPVVAKASDGIHWHKIAAGWNYLLTSFREGFLLPVGVLALGNSIMVLAGKRGGWFLHPAQRLPQQTHSVLPADSLRPAPRLIIVLFALASSSFIVVAGGDWMGGGRFVAHMLPLVIVLALDGLYAMIQHLATRRERFAQQDEQNWQNRRMRLFRLAVGAIFAVQVFGMAHFAREKSMGMPLWESFGQEVPFATDEFSWFETTNRIHQRDIPTIHRLQEVIERIRAEEPSRPLVILSFQMGMVPYEITTRFEDITFLDIKGLVEPRFTTCPLTERFPSTQLGLELDPRYYLRHQSLIAEECGIVEPDILFFLTKNKFLEAVLDNGYVLVYRQYGTSRSTYGRSLMMGQYIAVRQELAREFALEEEYMLFDTPIKFDAETFLLTGRVYREQGNYSKALADLNRAAEIAPDWHAPHLERGRVFLQQSRWDKAVPAVYQALCKM